MQIHSIRSQPQTVIPICVANIPHMQILASLVLTANRWNFQDILKELHGSELITTCSSREGTCMDNKLTVDGAQCIFMI